MRVTRHIVDIDTGQRDAERCLGAGHGWQDDLEQKIGAGSGSLVIFDGPRGAQNVIGGNAFAVAGKLVTAARSANAAQDSAADECLQNGFQVPRRQAVTCGKGLCGNRLPMLLHRDIDNRGDSENSFAGQQRHREEQTRVRGDCSPERANILQVATGG